MSDRKEHAAPTYEREREVAVDAARKAAAVIRKQAREVTEADVREKGVHDLVTATDEEAQRIILHTLSSAFPSYEVLAEEEAGTEEAPPAANGHRWIVDPLDGTTNFTRGVPPYAVSIALQREAEVVVGVVLDVPKNELFTAVRGGGLYADGKRVRVSPTRSLDRSLLTTGFPYRSFGHVEAYLEVLGTFMRSTRGVRRPGAAAVDLAWVAAGRFDGFFETGLMPWDMAAGVLLVEEGGGRVTDYRGAPQPLFTGQILATNGPLHEPMLEVVRPMRDVRG